MRYYGIHILSQRTVFELDSSGTHLDNCCVLSSIWSMQVARDCNQGYSPHKVMWIKVAGFTLGVAFVVGPHRLHIILYGTYLMVITHQMCCTQWVIALNTRILYMLLVQTLPARIKIVTCINFDTCYDSAQAWNCMFDQDLDMCQKKYMS